MISLFWVRASLLLTQQWGPLDFINLWEYVSYVNIRRRNYQRMSPLKESPLSFKVTEALKAELQRLADTDKRGLSQYIRIVLEEHVAAKKAAAKKR